MKSYNVVLIDNIILIEINYVYKSFILSIKIKIKDSKYVLMSC